MTRGRLPGLRRLATSMRPKPSKAGKGPDSAAWSDLARLLSGGPVNENEEPNGAAPRRTGSGPRHARSGVTAANDEPAAGPDVTAEPDAVAEPDLKANGVGIEGINAVVPQAGKDAVTKAEDDIKSGAVTVPDTVK